LVGVLVAVCVAVGGSGVFVGVGLAAGSINENENDDVIDVFPPNVSGAPATELNRKSYRPAPSVPLAGEGGEEKSPFELITVVDPLALSLRRRMPRSMLGSVPVDSLTELLIANGTTPTTSNVTRYSDEPDDVAGPDAVVSTVAPPLTPTNWPERYCSVYARLASADDAPGSDSSQPFAVAAIASVQIARSEGTSESSSAEPGRHTAMTRIPPSRDTKLTPASTAATGGASWRASMTVARLSAPRIASDIRTSGRRCI
jgi:hypothetical protein